MKNRLWSHRDFIIRELNADNWVIREWWTENGYAVGDGPFVGSASTRLKAQRLLDDVIRERNARYDEAPAVALD